jgi:hypothetical protein
VEDLFCETGDLPPILLPRRETEEGLQYLLPYFEGKIIDMDPSTSIIRVSVIKLLVQRLYSVREKMLGPFSRVTLLYVSRSTWKDY